MDPFQVLGVSEGATEKQIRQAFRRRAARHHPSNITTVADRRGAHDRLGELTHALSLALDPEALERHRDVERRRAAGESAAGTAPAGSPDTRAFDYRERARVEFVLRDVGRRDVLFAPAEAPPRRRWFRRR